MLEEMDAGQLAEWRAFEEWEDEMNTRASMQARANASLTELRQGQR
jgi:hypothetical protein